MQENSTPFADGRRRTATFCREIGRREGLAPNHVEAIAAIALCLGGEASPVERAPQPQEVSGLVDRLTWAARGNEITPTRLERDLLDVLSAAQRFNDLCTTKERTGQEPFSQAIRALRTDLLSHPAVALAIADIRGVTQDSILALLPQLPVFPAMARKALQVLGDPNASLFSVEALIGLEPVLAGSVIRAASTVGRMGFSNPVATVGEAVRRLGTASTARIVLAEALKPLLAVEGHATEWLHAVQVATLARKVSTVIEGVDPEEAYLVALVHDCGTLLLKIADQQAQMLKARLIAGDCSVATAESLAFETNHAEAGAAVVESWHFPAQHVEAIRWHHEPEYTTSKLAALLYVLEQRTSHREHVASAARMAASLQRLGMTEAMMDKQISG